ncbi:hypothetical protein GQ42DRAFT_165792 [Ramicandelaber brevisporus]|nr:hypothetical protein GQ42DRAFT_165792 [Ramicandelaber brevisporus]
MNSQVDYVNTDSMATTVTSAVEARSSYGSSYGSDNVAILTACTETLTRTSQRLSSSLATWPRYRQILQHQRIYSLVDASDLHQSSALIHESAFPRLKNQVLQLEMAVDVIEHKRNTVAQRIAEKEERIHSLQKTREQFEVQLHKDTSDFNIDVKQEVKVEQKGKKKMASSSNSSNQTLTDLKKQLTQQERQLNKLRVNAVQNVGSSSSAPVPSPAQRAELARLRRELENIEQQQEDRASYKELESNNHGISANSDDIFNAARDLVMKLFSLEANEHSKEENTTALDNGCIERLVTLRDYVSGTGNILVEKQQAQYDERSMSLSRLESLVQNVIRMEGNCAIASSSQSAVVYLISELIDAINSQDGVKSTADLFNNVTQEDQHVISAAIARLVDLKVIEAEVDEDIHSSTNETDGPAPLFLRLAQL